MFSEYFINDKKQYYTPCLGVSGSNIIVYNEYIHVHAK